MILMGGSNIQRFGIRICLENTERGNGNCKRILFDLALLMESYARIGCNTELRFVCAFFFFNFISYMSWKTRRLCYHLCYVNVRNI